MYTLHRQPSVLTFPWLMKSTNKQFFFRYLLLRSPGIHSLTTAKHMLIGSAPKLLYALNIFLGALYVVLFVSEFGIPKYFTQKWWHGMPKALGSNPGWGLIDFSLADLWLTFHCRLRLAPNSQNPWLFLRNMPHSIYRILATIIVKIYLSFPKITVTFIHDILDMLWIEFFEVHNWMPGSSFLYSIYWY